MYKIDFKKLEEEIKNKKFFMLIELLIVIVINSLLAYIYFKISNKDFNIGKICLLLSIISISIIIYTIYQFICSKKSYNDAKYLTNNGILVKNLSIRVEHSILPFDLKPCVYYIDNNQKLHILKARNNLLLMGKSKVDLLVDKKNPKRYYIDSNIKTTSKYDEEKNLNSFSKDIYPDYINYYEDNSICKNNITIFAIGIFVSIYVILYVADTLPSKAMLGVLSVFLLSGIINLTRKIISNNKMIDKIKYLSKNGKLFKDYKYEKKIITNNKTNMLIPTIKHDGKELVGDKIPFDTKDKIDLLIDEKKNIYYIDYDIKTFKEKYK